MTKKEILDYVMNTPGNTNRAVLNNMLDGLESSGGGDVKVLEVHFTKKDNYVYTCDVDQAVLREEYEAGTIIRGSRPEGGGYYYVTDKGGNGTDNGIVFSHNSLYIDAYEGEHTFYANCLYASNITTNDYVYERR